MTELPVQYVSNDSETPLAVLLDLLALDTQNPPGETREPSSTTSNADSTRCP
ncbi:hypothetical protein ACFPYI_20055 [Halomarina salina]|uniref:Uncharacterized protein n=1 Tax=Halomarina salina TaxID=1872699 RepID=A0ABD5RU26_9EURY|nr:hypothetical protein [Halomarina salina]